MMCILIILLHVLVTVFIYAYNFISNFSRPQQEVIAPKSLGCFSYFTKLHIVLNNYTTYKYVWSLIDNCVGEDYLLDSRIIAYLRINNLTSACQKSLASRCAMSFLHFNTTEQFFNTGNFRFHNNIMFLYLILWLWQKKNIYLILWILASK